MTTTGKRSLAPLVAALEQEPAPAPTDGDLLRRFLSRQDETAFETLVRRHGPMVLAVCRRALGCTADAEDAFQATFLVLLRKAPGLTSRPTIGDWLHGVARRTASKARVAAARRRARESAAARPEGNPEVERNDWLPWLDEEVGRLPAKYRQPLVLCDLEGRTRGEAARALGWPEGTVAGYLARGRALLAKRLLRRAALGGVVAGAVAGGDAQAVPVRLLAAALPTALGSASPVVLALAREVTRSMTTHVLALGVLALVAGGLLAAGTLLSGTPEPKPPVADAPNVPGAATEPGPPLAPPDHGDRVYSVSYAPDGKRFVSVGGGTAAVWDSETHKKVFTLDAEFASFSGDGKALFVLVKDEFRTHDAETGKEISKKARDMPKALRGGRVAAFAPDGKMHVEFDGISHHLRGDFKGDLPVLGEQYTNGDITGDLDLVYGRGGAFSPSDKQFAGIHKKLKNDGDGEQGVLSIWNGAAKWIGAIHRDANHPVQCFVWAPARDPRTDHHEIAVGYGDSVRVYTMPNVTEARKFDVKDATALAWSKDGKTLAVAQSVGEYKGNTGLTADLSAFKIAVVLIDATTGKELRRVDGFPDNLPIVSLAFAPDGKHLLCGAGFFPDDGPASNVPKPAKDAKGLRVIPLDAKSDPKSDPKTDPNPGPVAWKETKVLSLPGWLAGSVAYSPDGKTFYIGGTNGKVEAYAAATLKRLWEHQEPTNFPSVAASPDGKSIAVTFRDGDRRWGVRLLNVATRKEELTLDEGGVPGMVGSLQPLAVGFFPDTTIFPEGGDKVAVTFHKLIFGTAAGYVVKTWADPEKASTINSKTVAAGKLPADSYAVPLAIDPNGKRVVVTGPIDKDTGKNVLWAWSAGSGEANKLLEGHKGMVVSAAWSKNGKVIVTGDDAGVVIVWDAETFKEKSRVKLRGRVAAVAVTHDGIGIAAGVVNSAPGNNTAGEVFVWPAGEPPEKPEPLSSQLTGTPFVGPAALAFSPDGKQLVSCFANHTLLTRSGILIGHVRVFAVVPVPPVVPEKPAPAAKYIGDVSFSPDDKKYLTVSGGKVEVFDTATGKQLYSVVAEAARFTADKKLFVMSEKVLECDPETGKTIKEHPRPKPKWGWHLVSFSPDGTRYAAHFGFNVRIYDTATGFEPQQLDNQHEPGSSALPATTGKQLVWAPDGKQVAAVGVLVDVGKVGMAGWDVETGKRFYSFASDFTDGPRAVAFSSDSKAIVIGYEKRVDVWTGGLNPVKNLGEHGPVSALAFAPDRKTLAAGIRLPIFHGGDKPPRVIGHKTEVRLIDLATAKVLKVFDGFEGVNHMAETKLPVTALAFSPDGKKLIAGTGIQNFMEIPKDAPKSGEVKVFDVPAPPEKADPAPAVAQKWADAAVLSDHGRLVNGVAVAPDGKSFAAATDGNVTCWSAATRKVLWTYKADAPFLALAYSPDSKHLFVAGKTEVARLDAATGNKLKLFGDATGIGLDNFRAKIKEHHVRALAVSGDGKRLAGSAGQLVWTVELENPANHGTHSYGDPPAKDAVSVPTGVAWSKDGEWLAVIHPKHTGRTFPSGALPDTHWKVRVWNIAAVGAGPVLPGHDAPVTAVAWSKDGKVLASSDEKGVVILCDVATGKELWRHMFKGRDNTIGRVNALAISPADNTVAAAVSLGSGKGADRVVLLGAKAGEVVGQVMRWSIPVSSVAWSPDGKFLVTGCGAAGQALEQTEPAVGEVVVWERKP